MTQVLVIYHVWMKFGSMIYSKSMLKSGCRFAWALCQEIPERTHIHVTLCSILSEVPYLAKCWQNCCLQCQVSSAVMQSQLQVAMQQH